MEFVVPHEKSHLVLEKIQRIHQLFCVSVSLSSPPSSAKSTGVQWIRLKGPEKNNEKAKEYINSLCTPDLDNVVSFPETVHSFLLNSLDKLEYDSGACITLVSNHQARIRGSQVAVVMASSAIDELKIRPGSRSMTFDIDPALKEFAMKLGYTDKDIQVVVKKHGPMVNENTLLHELIKISRTGPTSTSRSPSRQPCAEAERDTLSKGLNPVPSQNRDVLARGPPSLVPPSRVMTVKKDRVSYEKSGNPSMNESVERQRVPLEEEQMMYQQLFGDKDVTSNGSSSSGLRHIVIDGSNVAMSHGNQEVFSCFGIALCVNWFKQRGHKDITVFVPQWRKEAPKPDSPMTDQEILSDLEKERIVVFTPSRRVNGRRIVCYDDRFIVRLAAETDGIIVSNDNYRDLVNENPKWKEVIEQRLLMFSFVSDIFMVPDDPLGRHGPTLDDFLRKGTVSQPRICPYLKKCTFGLKCRFYHPERDPARKHESTKQFDQVATRSVGLSSYDSRRTELGVDRQPFRQYEGTPFNGQDVWREHTVAPGGVYESQQHNSYPDYYQHDFSRQPMLPVNRVRQQSYVDQVPCYGPNIHQMATHPFPPRQRLVNEQLVGSGYEKPGEVLDSPWDKDQKEMFEQLRVIYSQPEHEEIIRSIVQNGHGKNIERLAAEVSEQMDK